MVFILALTFTAFVHLGAGGEEQQQQQQEQPYYYDLCAPFLCGNISFVFPFSSVETFGAGHFSCGLPRFQIACDRISSVPTIQLSGRSYQVKQMLLPDHLITVADNPLISDVSLGNCNSFGNLLITGHSG